MEELKLLLPPKLLEAIERAGINTTKQITILSCWDIKKLTNMSNEDIVLLKQLVCEHAYPDSTTIYELIKQEKYCRITSGCGAIDRILNGGFRTGAITEIYGESGSGKTQIGLQAAAHNWSNYSVYICTEDTFPIKRFAEISRGMRNSSDVDYGSTTFVEHITESNDLISCTRVRLPKLLEQKKFTLIVIDSIAAPFRVESTNYVQRAEEMREMAILLLSLSQKFNLAIICINQVTAAFDSLTVMLPSLGLAWSNMVSTRLYLEKTSKTVYYKNKENDIDCPTQVRQLSVVFAPDLPMRKTEFIIRQDGLQS